MRAYESSNEVGHYGLLDLFIDRMSDLRYRIFGGPGALTLMHVTHAKAGSTWIAHFLSRLFRGRCAPRGENVAGGVSLADYVFEPGRVYSAMFLTREEVAAHPELTEVPRFVVIRDLRDTLISLYFSLKISHPTGHSLVGATRATLQNLEEEDGLLHLIENRLHRIAALQCSWIGSGDLVLRYEDLVTHPSATLGAALIDRLQLPISRTSLHRAIRRTHFQNVFKRKLGDENVNSHGRTGLPGDWRRHFTPSVRRHFADKFGEVLISTGYERDDQWVRPSKDSTQASNGSRGGITRLLSIAIAILIPIFCDVDQDDDQDGDLEADDYAAVLAVRGR
jgi:lipopolysaccharide transport system ATP-binding protein